MYVFEIAVSDTIIIINSKPIKTYDVFTIMLEPLLRQKLSLH